ncbi:aldehyde dehydrogenase family protein [Brevibacterium sp. RIT 803]|uniref:aldehyde dehydrogenase family protein n=1 Tax=Brevibacterium sp. RIT 803 TaxID=2810210 RepID=UPI00194DE288|nr:aldehyde dehydrogenase family protein [Brevibacterium sp. RIT 803]
MTGTNFKIGAGIQTINPTSGNIIDEFEFTGPKALSEILDEATATFAQYKRSTVTQRVDGIRRLSAILSRQRDEFATQITREMGKPITQAHGEIDKCINACEYYATHLPEMLKPRDIEVTPDRAAVHLRPLGVIFAILPWNYPWWQVVRAMLPAIAVGNVVVLKHAESVTGCAFSIQDAFREAFGSKIMNTVVLPGERASETIGDDRIAAVTFTGSERVGALVAQAAGAALKKCVLELGGSDPFIVLDDADVESAAKAAVKSRFLNNGQSCIAAKRILVPRKQRSEFVASLDRHLQELSVGDPMDPKVEVGPIARYDLLNDLNDQRSRAVASGDLVLGETAHPAGPGAWFAPILMEVQSSDSPLLREETFGPLGAVTFYETEEDAVAIANDTQYGLSSAVWSSDETRAQRVAARIKAGSVFINGISASDPRLPVGGIKASGYGRELADYGLAEFANIQAVRVTSTGS